MNIFNKYRTIRNWIVLLAVSISCGSQSQSTPELLTFTTPVRSFLEDRNGKLWIGTVESGLWRYDGKTITNYTEKDGLGSLFIPAMYKSKQGDMWFGGNGVYRFNGKSFEKIY